MPLGIFLLLGPNFPFPFLDPSDLRRGHDHRLDSWHGDSYSCGSGLRNLLYSVKLDWEECDLTCFVVLHKEFFL